VPADGRLSPRERICLLHLRSARADGDVREGIDQTFTPWPDQWAVLGSAARSAVPTSNRSSGTRSTAGVP
jgi:hypothetical protein